MSAVSGSLDANVLLRLLLNDMPSHHAAAVRLLEQSPGCFVVADTAIVEVVFVLEREYRLTRTEIAKTITGLASLAAIRCNQNLLAKALPVFTKNPKLSFEDCCLAAYADLSEAPPLWTFDRKLATQAPNAKLVPSKN